MSIYDQILAIIFIGIMTFIIISAFLHSNLSKNNKKKLIIIRPNARPLIDITITSLFSLGYFVGTTVLNSSHMIDNIIIAGVIFLVIFGLLVSYQKIIERN